MAAVIPRSDSLASIISTTSSIADYTNTPIATSPSRPLTQVSEQEEQEENDAYFAKIREKGVKISQSRLDLSALSSRGSTLSIAIPSKTEHDSSLDIPEAQSPLLHTPPAIKSLQFFTESQQQNDEKANEAAALAAAAASSMCFPRRANNQRQMNSMLQAIKLKAEKKHHNAKLTNSNEWMQIIKNLESKAPTQIETLLARLKTINQNISNQTHVVASSDVVYQQVDRIFHDISNANYIIQRELFSLGEGAKKPKKVSAPPLLEVDATSPSSQPLQLDRVKDAFNLMNYLLVQFPQRLEMLTSKLDELDTQQEDYDSRLNLSRIRRIVSFLEDAVLGFDELRQLLRT